MKRNKNFVDNKPLLYLLATPIGNLQELSRRALEILSSADLIACEDTRNTFSLLSHYGLKKNLISLREHNEKAMSQKVVEEILSGKKVVYVSDAGYPCISDPGSILAKECLANDINVSTISGSSAFINALVSSGLDSDHFYFYGFLSSKDSEAKKELEQLKSFSSTLIFYESPHRIERTIELLNEYFGDRQAVIARELTKKNEEYIRGSLSEFLSIDPPSIIGEIVIVVEGNNDKVELEEEKIIEHLSLLLNKGMSKKDASEVISKIDGVNKNDVYDLAIKLK